MPRQRMLCGCSNRVTDAQAFGETARAALKHHMSKRDKAATGAMPGELSDSLRCMLSNGKHSKFEVLTRSGHTMPRPERPLWYLPYLLPYLSVQCYVGRPGAGQPQQLAFDAQRQQSKASSGCCG